VRGFGSRTWLPLGVAVFLMVVPRTSHAQYAVGADASAVTSSGGAWGLGIDGRFGYRFGLPRAWIWHNPIFQLEAIAGYQHLFSGSQDVDVGRLGGGGRIGFLVGAFEPFGFAHISVADTAGGWGSLWDAGVALDWRAPTFNVGVHGARDSLSVGTVTDDLWELGLHFEIRGFWL